MIHVVVVVMFKEKNFNFWSRNFKENKAFYDYTSDNSYFDFISDMLKRLNSVRFGVEDIVFEVDWQNNIVENKTEVYFWRLEDNFKKLYTNNELNEFYEEVKRTA